jgi:hypothetical protein
MTRQKYLAAIEQAAKKLNTILAEDCPQSVKAGICTTIEAMLSAADCYDGYGNLYWRETGFRDWQEAGEPEFPEKMRYIIGPENGGPSTGEYSRVYYLGKLRDKLKTRD